MTPSQAAEKRFVDTVLRWRGRPERDHRNHGTHAEGIEITFDPW
jgi:hypothetical protein